MTFPARTVPERIWIFVSNFSEARKPFVFVYFMDADFKKIAKGAP